MPTRHDVLSAIYRDVPDTFFRTVYVNDPNKLFNEGKTSFLRSVDAMEDRIAQDCDHATIYIAPSVLWKQPEKTFQRGDMSCIGGIVAVGMDIDFAGKGNNRPYPPDADTVLRLIRGSFPEPSIRIATGNGEHWWWLLVKPWLFGDDKRGREDAASFVKRVHAAVAAPVETEGYVLDSTHDLARVLRVPGTLNFRDLSNPKPVELVFFDDTRRFSVEELLPLLPPDEDPVKETALAVVKDVVFHKNVTEFSPRFLDLMTKDARVTDSVYVRTREDLHDNSASGHDYSLISLMYHANFTPQEVLDALVTCYHKRGTPLKAPSYYKRSIGRIFDEQDTEGTDIGGEEVIALLRRRTRLPVRAIIQCRTENAKYYMVMDDGSWTLLGDRRVLIEWKPFQYRIFEVTKQYIDIPATEWETLRHGWAAIIELVSATDMAVDARDMLVAYLREKPPVGEDERVQALRRRQPFIENGKVLLCPEEFRIFVNALLREGYDRTYILGWLRSLSFESVRLSYRNDKGKNTSASYWAGLLPEELQHDSSEPSDDSPL